MSKKFQLSEDDIVNVLSSCEVREGTLYRVERLHNVPSLILECCDLINLEWKRSQEARLRSINNSNENFPMSLVLLKYSGKPKVVGHCKISKLLHSNDKVFVETVVIYPDLRGKGLGSFLMKECEKVCKSKNIKWIYLSTLGQRVFYEKLGYSECPPISIYGCQTEHPNTNFIELEKKLSTVQVNPKLKKDKNEVNNSSPIPPPPPPPPSIPINLSVSNLSTSKTFLKKEVI